MHSVRTLPLRARPLQSMHRSQLCRSFSSQLTLKAQGEGSAAAAESQSTSKNAPASKSSEPLAQTSPADESVAARRRRTTDSLTAFINQMMPLERDSKRSPRRSAGFNAAESLSERDHLDAESPISRKQGDILRGVTRGQDYAESFSSTRGAGKLPPLAPPVRLDPYIGRAEAVEGGVTLARALDKLNIKLSVNQVRWDIRRQMFHERGGLKRKRQRRERWRNRFKAGFIATVKKVQRMKAQGW